MPLMEGIEVKGDGSIQRILDIFMLRYGALNEAMILGENGGEARGMSPKRFQAWTEGFPQAVDANKRAWPKRALSRDDKQILNMIRSHQMAGRFLNLKLFWPMSAQSCLSMPLSILQRGPLNRPFMSS